MPVERYRDAREIPRVPRAPEEDLVARIAGAWCLAHLRGPPDIPRGVMKFHDIIAAQQARSLRTRKRLLALRGCAVSSDGQLNEDGPVDEHELVAYLMRRLPSFCAYWQEVASVYGVASALQAATNDALGEFARHVLELWQDGHHQDLMSTKERVAQLLQAKNATTRALGEALVERIRTDWCESGADEREFRRLWMAPPVGPQRTPQSF